MQAVNLRFCAELLQGLDEIAVTARIVGGPKALDLAHPGSPDGEALFATRIEQARRFVDGKHGILPFDRPRGTQ